MIAKNVSAKTLDLSELDSQYTHFASGDEIDLSRYTDQQKSRCVHLQAAFEVGDMVIISTGKSILARKRRLEATQDHLRNIGLCAASIPVSASTIPDRCVKSLDKRVQQGALSPRMHTLTEEDAFPLEQLPDEETGIITVSSTGIQILKPSDICVATASVTEKKSLSPDKIRTLASQFHREKCQGISKSGRCCKKRAVIGYSYCLTHMPSDMREQYQLERLQKAKSGQ